MNDTWLIRVLCGALLWAAGLGSLAGAQALSPDEALRRFKVPDGFEVQLYASEPMVRQPVTMSFDDRGRVWVIQYLQYPNPAGLRPVQVDRYLRTRYDRVPEPPPHGPRGADKITILEDTDGDGRADRAKDFVTGLNLASALAIGNGGIYVGQAPYLLFYPDRNGDDVPDGDPEVLLKGFGLEDAHAVVNSLQWGPDGWLYGAQGSTVTADIRGVGFQQGLWRYHPPTKRFELFSEGGGNTWGLDFDRHGQALAGTNWSNALCLHQVQGGYYVKGFTKHGPLHNPYTYGYFEHVAHSGHAGGHVTCGGIVYQGDAYPSSFANCYVGANLLSNAVYWSSIERTGSTFKTTYQGTLLETDDIWFRPIDCLGGPDGSVYVVDWYDQRANHVIPVDNWDKSNGRIWKVVYRGTPAPRAQRLSDRHSMELVKLLEHPNAWHRREARRILAERRDPATYGAVREYIRNLTDQRALEALWALYVSGGWNQQLGFELLDHQNEHVRAWNVRLLGDDRPALSEKQRQRLVRMATEEPAVVVRSQLACTAKRLSSADGLPIVAALLRRNEDASDAHLPLLLWWAIEDKSLADIEGALALVADPAAWRQPIIRGTIVERLARRYLAERSPQGFAACARLLAQAPDEANFQLLVSAMDQDFGGRPLAEVPPELAGLVDRLLQGASQNPTGIRLAIRLGSPKAYELATAQIADGTLPSEVRVPLISAVGQAARESAPPALIRLFDERAEPIQLAALAALEHCGDPAVAAEVLARYATWPASLRARSIAMLCSRPAWSRTLLEAVSAGTVDAKDVSVDQLRQILAHRDQQLALGVEQRWGKVRAATPGEKHSYVPVLGRVLAAGAGDLESGHKLFVKHCATCHTLFGEGNKIGPDLTSADRKNRDALLLNILDPSGYVRPEYVAQTVVLVDGRVLTGLVTESNAQEITLVDAKNQKTVVARGDIEEVAPSAQSLMPEQLLESLAPQELRDLFRYLQSNGPAPAGT